MALGQATLLASEAVPLLQQKAWAEVDYRFEACRVTKGTQIQ
jgi:hypothetical protein